MNGDIFFSIVVNCLKISRIWSILLFFKNDESIVKIINDDGNLLLYFFVKSLKEMNEIDELECCVRVVIFILYGVNLNKKLDDEKRVD